MEYIFIVVNIALAAINAYHKSYGLVAASIILVVILFSQVMGWL